MRFRWRRQPGGGRCILTSMASLSETRRAAVELVAGGYFDKGFWGRKVAYPAYVGALMASGYDGYIDWEFCHPAMENGQPADINYVHNQTRLALEYMRGLRAEVCKAPRRHGAIAPTSFHPGSCAACRRRCLPAPPVRRRRCRASSR